MKIQKGYRILGLAVTVVMIMTFTACSKSADEQSSAKEEVSNAAEAAKDYINDERKAAVEELKTSYDEFAQKFEEFKQRNSFVFSEEKRNLVSKVEANMTQMEQQFVQARSAADETWEQIKADVTAKMKELEQAWVDFES